MKNLILLLLLLPSWIYAQLPANCSGSAPRIAIAGDSWAQYMADDNTHNVTLNMYGHGDKSAISSTYEMGILCTSNPGATDYAVSGSEAAEWADETNFNYLQNLINALNANPTIDHVMLSIGGNDVLRARSNNGWYNNMDLDNPGSEQALFDEIIADTDYIINQVWARARPNIKFIISGYDYPNFNVTGSFLLQDYCDFYACPKRVDLSRDENGNGQIDENELITDEELNGMMTVVEQIRKNYADSHANVFFDNGQGLMHYYYGFDDSTYPAFSPGTTAQPGGTTPYPPGGNSTIPTDRDNFRTVEVCGIGSFPADPIHLDKEGYEYKIKHQLDNIYFDDFRGTPDMTFFSDGATDGYTDILGETANGTGIRVGDDGSTWPWGSASNDYRGILSFNTANIPDNAVITDASLYIMRSGANDNPFEKGDRNAVLDIKSGYFGDNASLDWTDGNAPADATNIACFHGKAENDKYAIRADFNSGLDFINKTGFTQLRMYFDVVDWSVEYINFYDGGGAAAYLPPTVEALQNPPVYTTKTVKRYYDQAGNAIDTTIAVGQTIEKREGYVYQYKLKKVDNNDNGTETLHYVSVAAIEHPGLAHYMATNEQAPANGYAPFLDIKYIIVLPMELTAFTARPKNDEVLLEWETQAEQNSDYFVIEHSKDNAEWLPIGEVKASGDSHETINYTFTDREPNFGKNYYRLRMVDLDGSYDYSEIRAVDFRKGEQILTVYPNPFSREVTIEADFVKAEFATLEVIDILGRPMLSEQIFTPAGRSKLTTSALADLPKGTYMIRILSRYQTYTGKVVKE